MNRSVLLSLLALDSYNHGEDQNLAVDSAGIGDAVYRRVPVPGTGTGFYASVYDWNGTTVLSYRGTNFTGVVPAAQDILNGWSMFSGFGTDSQLYYARQFFRQVTGSDFLDESVEVLPNAIVTGHSLGGGLAGYVGSLSGAEAVVFDPIPYGAAAWQTAVSDAFKAAATHFALDAGQTFTLLASAVLGGSIGGSTVLWDAFADQFRRELNLREPDLSTVVGAALQGEIASSIVTLQAPIAAIITPLFPMIGLGALASNILEGLVQDRSHVATIPNFGAENNPNALHSMSLGPVRPNAPIVRAGRRTRYRCPARASPPVRSVTSTRRPR